MPDPTSQPPAPQSPPDMAAHLSALADAMRQLAESQKALVEQVKPAAKPQASTPQASTPQASTPPAFDDITGDPTGGVSPAALGTIDYAKLSPLQQITLGLRDTRPAPPHRAGAD